MKNKVNTSYIRLDFTISICVGESTTTVTMTLIVVKMVIIFSSHANIVFHVLTRDTTLKEDTFKFVSLLRKSYYAYSQEIQIIIHLFSIKNSSSTPPEFLEPSEEMVTYYVC